MANTLKLGAGKWATGTDTVLAFNDENNNFKPLPFDFSRASSATVVNQSGLIETVGSGEPRIDFEGNTKGALLLEPSRTNLWTESEGTSIILNSPLGEFGFYTLKNSQISRTISASDPISFTFIVKKIDGTIPTITSSSGNGDLVIYVSGGSGAGISGVLTDIGNGFYKYELKIANAGGGSQVIQNKSGVDTYVSLIQFEVGSYATSYIPTSGSAVTRVADSCNQTVPSGIIGQTEGSVFFDLNTTLKNYSVISISDGTNANRVVFYFSAVLNQIASYITKSNVNSSTILSIVNSYPNSNYKVVIKYNSIGFYIFANGGLIGTILSNYSFPNNTLNEIKLSSPDNSNFFEGKVKNIKVYNQSLTDSEAIALTTI